MRYLICFLAFFIVACGSKAGSSKHPLIQRSIMELEFRADMQQYLKKQEKKIGGNIGLSLVVPQRQGLTIDYNGDRLFHAASTMKTPVMIEVFQRSEAGEFSMNDKVIVSEDCKSFIDNSPFKIKPHEYLETRIGKEETILRLTEEMMIYSDNLATNQLIAMLGPANITETMRGLGVEKGFVLRGLNDMPSYRAGLSNRMTPNDLNALLVAIEDGKAGNEQSTAEMKRILLEQDYEDMIPYLLPDGVKVGHKTGFISGTLHDSAIVYAPYGHFYLTIMTDDLEIQAIEGTDEEKDERTWEKDIISEIALKIYNDLQPMMAATAGP